MLVSMVSRAKQGKKINLLVGGEGEFENTDAVIGRLNNLAVNVL
jgi:hypothetical protein